MKLIIKSKSFFIFLVLSILSVLIINFFVRNKNISSQQYLEISPTKEGKTIGVNIEQNQSDGEKITIVADQMMENQEKKIIKLINLKTKIIKKNDVTEITSKFGTILNNYKKFKLNEEVNISNNKKKFILKTENLNGVFDTGEMNTNTPVRIEIKNSTIHGSRLNLLNFGEYVKVFGKAKLIIN